MRRIRIMEHLSLDGMIAPAGPGHDSDSASGGWTAPHRSPEGAQMLAAAYGQDYDLLLGRRTYDQWSGHWPKMSGGPFAPGLNAATKHVVTHRPEGLAWGPVKALGPDALSAIQRLKSEDGPDLLVCGSSSLTSMLLEHRLVDELVLTVYPLFLGRGVPLFDERMLPRPLALVSSKATPTGVLLNVYRPA